MDARQKRKRRKERQERQAAKRPGRRPESRAESRADHDDPLIGYVATNGITMVCKGTACIVAGSREQMARFVEDAPPQPGPFPMRIEPARFSSILACYLHGGAYCLDQTAYERFLGPGRRWGLPLPEADFSHTDPSQVKLVTIFRKDLPQGW
jgi:hypothetical protein